MPTAGSSPLARGLLKNFQGRGVQWRIIPARAGFTFRSPSFTHLRRDHPRSRGVYCDPLLSEIAADGSSPLARGLRVPLEGPWGPGGIIPARAGFTCEGSMWVRSYPDHPRSRGVYAFLASFAVVSAGSSPLARGLRERDR